MKPSLNYDSKDPKFILLDKIFNIIGSKNFKDICSRNGITNRQMMIKSIKILFMAMYFDYAISEVIDELNRSSKLRTFAGFSNEVPTASQIYEYFSRYSSEQYCKIMNSALMKYNKQNRGTYNPFIVDGTPVACDFNVDKKYITLDHLNELKLKWAYSTTKGHYIGFKATVVINKKLMLPVAVLVHSGSPNDSKIFIEVLEELRRRRIIKRKDIIYFDKGYYALKNYIIGINKYKIIPVIFPKVSFKEEKLRDRMSYPLEVFLKNKRAKTIKNDTEEIFKVLCEKLNKWKNFKPLRGLIEDFFKVGKDAFGLGKFHSYTAESMKKNIYLCILLTALIVQEGYKTKTQLQRLSEGNVVQNTPVKKKTNKKANKTKNTNKEKTPSKTKQTKLKITKKATQTTLKKFFKI